MDIGTDHRVADGIKRRFNPFFFRNQIRLNLLALTDVNKGTNRTGELSVLRCVGCFVVNHVEIAIRSRDRQLQLHFFDQLLAFLECEVTTNVCHQWQQFFHGTPNSFLCADTKHLRPSNIHTPAKAFAIFKENRNG